MACNLRELDDPFLKTGIMIVDFHVVETLKDDIDNLKIMESENEMTDDRCLYSIRGILSFPELPMLLSLSILFSISIGEKYTLLI